MTKKKQCFTNFLLNASPRQKQVYYAVVNPKGFEAAPTYKELSQSLGMALGTLYTHLKRIRDTYPLTYKRMMSYRKKQLATQPAKT